MPYPWVGGLVDRFPRAGNDPIIELVPEGEALPEDNRVLKVCIRELAHHPRLLNRFATDDAGVPDLEDLKATLGLVRQQLACACGNCVWTERRDKKSRLVTPSAEDCDVNERAPLRPDLVRDEVGGEKTNRSFTEAFRCRVWLDEPLDRFGKFRGG